MLNNNFAELVKTSAGRMKFFHEHEKQRHPTAPGGGSNEQQSMFNELTKLVGKLQCTKVGSTEKHPCTLDDVVQILVRLYISFILNLKRNEVVYNCLYMFSEK
jgi:hypothetical protein